MISAYSFRILRTGFTVLLVFIFAELHSQTTVITDSIINDYRSVVSIVAKVNTNPDSVYVTDASVFNKNEIVLFIVSKGATVYTSGGNKGVINSLNNTGKYALIYIDTVDYLNNLVIFNSTLPGVTDISSIERAQLVTVPKYKNVVFSDTLTCKAWDSVTGTGGVLAFIVKNTLELQADIDVSGKGFKGSDPGSEKYQGTCSSVDIGYQEDYFTLAAKDSGAVRGEGISFEAFPYPRGRLRAGNSGSGGNAKYSGGGGGANFGNGGKGGKEHFVCSSAGDLGGIGGQSLNTFYTNSGTYENRVFMGGGGGTGTQDPDQSHFATPGGNGGGIIIFTANKVKSNGFNIIANGESVTEIASAGAGGGGGGGSVIIDAVEFIDAAMVLVKGGNGGHVVVKSDTTGPGGGGGGGFFWFSQSNVLFTPENVSLEQNSGSAGWADNDGLHSYGALNGGLGNRLGNLIIPRRGFLENRLVDDQVICENNIPGILDPPPAKGGSGGPYTYKWLKSEISEEGPWLDASGINSQQTYAAPALTDTTYFSRIISDGQLVDTSFAMMVAVHPAILNNNILDNDTICSQLSAGQLTAPSPVEGALGTGTYTYVWQESSDDSNWQPATGINNVFSYDTPVLTTSTFYRRKVSSGACIDSSNSVKILVLPLLTNNNIFADQIICHEQQPAALTGSAPVGGLAGDRKYQWQSTVLPDSWSELVNTPGYAPGILTDTTYYRRIVFSGPDNTCVNISDTIKITVLPPVQNNVLSHGDTVLCGGLPTMSLKGDHPTGGDGTYKYVWEKKFHPSGSWVVGEEISVLQPFEPGSLSDSTWFRRIVKSGVSDVCVNVSDSFLVKVLPALSNNIISASQVICENTAPVQLGGTLPVGGTGSYIYEWQKSPDGSSSWGLTIPQGEMRNYSPPALSSTTFYRRAVFSGPNNTCESFSGNVEIEVQPSITGNTILTASPLYTCFNTPPSILDGSSNPEGGDGLGYLFKWEESTNNTLWEPGSQTSNQEDYQPQTLTDSLYFRRIVNSGSCKDTTSALLIRINSLPVLNSLTGSDPDMILCDDEELFIKVDIEKGTAPYALKYTDGIAPGDISQDIPSDTSSFKVSVYGAEPNAFSFKLTSLTDNNGCNATASNLDLHQINLDVYRAARPVINMNDVEEICASSITLNALPDIGNGEWRNLNPLVVIDNPVNPVTPAGFTATNFNSLSEKFYYVESTPGCGEKKDSVTVIFYEQPEDAVILTDSTGSSPYILFMFDNILLTASAPSAGTGSWNIESGPGDISAQNDISAQLSELIINDPTKVVYTIANGVCDIKTDFIVIERKNIKIYEGISPNGDPLNEFLYAEGINRSDSEMNYVFTIFNSSGAFVRELTNETQLEAADNAVIWDGKTIFGNLAGDGTYYYVMKINYKGSQFVYKGFFVLKTE